MLQVNRLLHMSLLSDRFPQLRADKPFMADLEACARYIKLEIGDLVIKNNVPVTELPLVLRGSLKVIREHDAAHELLLYYVNPGETCSLTLVNVLSNRKSSVIAITEERAEVAMIPSSLAVRWMDQSEVWKEFVYGSFYDRNDEILHVVDLLAFNRMDQRLIHYLKEKAGAHDATVVYATHQDIAYELNTSREVISRLLKQMERDGTLELGRNRIRLNVDILQAS